MNRVFASLGVAASVAILIPLGCAAGTVPDIGTDDGGATVDGTTPDGAEAGGDCPTACTEGTPYCDRVSRKCVACLPTKDTCPVTTYCAAQSGGGYKCVIGCKTSASDCSTIPDGGTAACCTHACVDTTSSVANCGACGKTCSTAHLPSPSCQFAQCTGTCDFGWDDCNGNKQTDGCETNTQNDPKNCGSCGNSCSAIHIMNPTCNGGACGGACAPGWGDCNHDPTDGCEAPLNTFQNCGACGTVCGTLPNSTGPSCNMNSMCDYASCNIGFSDCDGNRQNGCECGTLPNTTGPMCTGTMCDYTSCSAGFQDCDGNRRNGCECHPPNVVSAVCGDAGLTCDYTTCSPGFQDCDGNRANGCESNKNADSNNCGGCGMRCPMGQGCTNGMCVPSTGTVTNVQGQTIPIIMVPCGNGTVQNCTQAVAQTSCTSIGKKLVSHASDGTTSVASLGATVSCEWSISYFTNTSANLAGQCLIGLSNASWSQCCTLQSWHGNIVTIPTTLGTQFGYVYATESGYNAGMSNVSGTTWGCITNTTAPPVTRPGCTVYNVACE